MKKPKESAVKKYVERRSAINNLYWVGGLLLFWAVVLFIWEIETPSGNYWSWWWIFIIFGGGASTIHSARVLRK